MAVAAGAMWLGPVPREAVAVYKRARQSGLTTIRALVIGQLGSFRDAWVFRRRLAAAVGCSVRTVQRAITQAKELGLIGVARGKKTETPQGASGPVECGWSHRWVIGWGKAGTAVETAVAAARARWMVKHAMQASKAPETRPEPKAPRRRDLFRRIGASQPTPNQRRWTAEELDAELARLEAKQTR